MSNRLCLFLRNTGCCGLKPLALMIISCTCVGFLIMMIGLILVLSCSFYEPPKIKEYNESVDKWNNDYMEEFSGNEISVNVSTNNFKFVTDLVGIYELITIRGFPELTPYTNLRYERDIGCTNKYSPTSSEVDLTVIATMPPARPVFLPTIKIRLWQMITMDKDIHKHGDCEKINGYYINGTCYWLYKLVTACTKLKIWDEGSTRHFALSDRYGGLGCKPNDKDLQQILSPWSVGQYQINPKQPNKTLGDVLSKFKILTRVRSEEDPSLLALNITNGGDFTSFYNATMTRMNIVRLVGIVLIIAGFLVMSSFFCLFVCCCFCKKTRKQLVTIGLSEEQELIYKYKEHEAQLKFEEKYGEEAKKLKRERVKFHLFPDEERKSYTHHD